MLFRRSRAQAAVEVLILLAIGMAVLALIMSAAQERLTSSDTVLRAQQSQSAANSIARAADEVYSQGVGSRRSIDLIIPEGIVGASLVNRTILLRLAQAGGQSDITARTAEDVYGSLPGVPGRYTIWITAEEQRVQIRAGLQDLALNPTLLYYNTPTSNSTQNIPLSTIATNLGSSTLTVNTQLMWASAEVSVGYANPADSSFSLLPAESRTITLNVVINASAAGTYTGSLTANASNGDTTQAAIAIEVISGACPSQTCPLSVNRTVARITGSTFSNDTYSRNKLIFDTADLVTPVTISSGNWTANSIITLNLLDPANDVVSGYPKLMLANSTGDFSDTYDPSNGSPGTYTILANDSTRSATWNFTITGCG